MYTLQGKGETLAYAGRMCQKTKVSAKQNKTIVIVIIVIIIIIIIIIIKYWKKKRKTPSSSTQPVVSPTPIMVYSQLPTPAPACG